MSLVLAHSQDQGSAGVHLSKYAGWGDPAEHTSAPEHHYGFSARFPALLACRDLGKWGHFSGRQVLNVSLPSLALAAGTNLSSG